MLSNKECICERQEQLEYSSRSGTQIRTVNQGCRLAQSPNTSVHSAKPLGAPSCQCRAAEKAGEYKHSSWLKGDFAPNVSQSLIL